MSVCGFSPWSFFFTSHFVSLGCIFLVAFFLPLAGCTGVLFSTEKTMGPEVIPMLESVLVFACRIAFSFNFSFEGGNIIIGCGQGGSGAIQGGLIRRRLHCYVGQGFCFLLEPPIFLRFCAFTVCIGAVVPREFFSRLLFAQVLRRSGK